MTRLCRLLAGYIFLLNSVSCCDKASSDIARQLEILNRKLTEESSSIKDLSATIRKKRAADFTEVQAYLRKLMPKVKMTLRVEADHVFFTYHFADRRSYLQLSDEVDVCNGEIAFLKVYFHGIPNPIEEIHFYNNNY